MARLRFGKMKKKLKKLKKKRDKIMSKIIYHSYNKEKRLSKFIVKFEKVECRITDIKSHMKLILSYE